MQDDSTLVFLKYAGVEGLIVKKMISSKEIIIRCSKREFINNVLLQKIKKPSVADPVFLGHPNPDPDTVVFWGIIFSSYKIALKSCFDETVSMILKIIRCDLARKCFKRMNFFQQQKHT